MSRSAITAFDGRLRRDEAGVWRHADTGKPVPGARDMVLADVYPGLVIVSGVVLVPDVLVRDNADLAWVRGVADGPTDSYDCERTRGHGVTRGWSRVWPVPVAEWDRRNIESHGVLIAGWTEGQELPR